MVHDQRDKETDEVAALAPGSGPLPPIPDGGLTEAMPAWLRDAPSSAPVTTETATQDGILGSRLDPAGFITEDDLPDWLRQLSTTDRPPSSPTAGTFPANSPSPRPPAHLASGSPSSGPAPRPNVPRSVSDVTSQRPAAVGDRLNSPTAHRPATDLAPQTRHAPGPIQSQTSATGSPLSPIPNEKPADSNRGVIVTGFVLVLIAAVIVIYLLASGIL